MSHQSGCTPASFRHLPSASSSHGFRDGMMAHQCFLPFKGTRPLFSLLSGTTRCLEIRFLSARPPRLLPPRTWTTTRRTIATTCAASHHRPLAPPWSSKGGDRGPTRSVVWIDLRPKEGSWASLRNGAPDCTTSNKTLVTSRKEFD